jgi:alanyl-tRNA synthetase
MVLKLTYGFQVGLRAIILQYDKSRDLRKKFIFLAGKNHQEVPAIPLVPKDDPTTLFTAAACSKWYLPFG